MILSGVAVRPPGSDGYWPPVGTRVPWTATQPINDLMEQDLKYPQFSNLGVIGNTDHLKKHGGHTPWRPGAVRGKVYAKDTACPPGFLAWLLKKCKSDYHTMWIRFFNCDNGQYDAAGNYLGWSGDHHFHCEVQNGYENQRVTLFDDFVRETQVSVMDARQEAILTATKNLVAGLQEMFVNGTSPTGTETTGGGIDRVYVFRHLDEDRDSIKKVVKDEITALRTSMSAEVHTAVLAAVADLGLSDAQVEKIATQVIAAVNRPVSGTWSTNQEV